MPTLWKTSHQHYAFGPILGCHHVFVTVSTQMAGIKRGVQANRQRQMRPCSQHGLQEGQKEDCAKALQAPSPAQQLPHRVVGQSRQARQAWLHEERLDQPEHESSRNQVALQSQDGAGQSMHACK